MSKVLSYKSLMKFLEQQWELNHREPSINIHRNDFIDRFGNVGFEFINQFLKDLDERYHAIRVTEYAYSEKWEDEKYMNLSAEEILRKNGSELTPKNIDALNITTLTTSIIIEPDFLKVLDSFSNPWEKKKDKDKEQITESLSLAKLRLKGRAFLVKFEGKEAEIWTYDSKKRKGFMAIKALLEAKGKMCLKDGLTNARLLTNTTQLGQKMFHLNKELSKIFYRYDKTRVALNYKVELNERDARIVRNYIKKKIREKRES